MNNIKVLLADDHQVVREKIRSLIELHPDLVVIGEATDGDSAVKIAATLKPDVTVMDVDMPYVNGIIATQRICQNEPSSKVVVLTMYADPVTKRNAVAAGAIDVIEKQPSPALLMSAIRAAHSCSQHAISV